MRRRDGHQGVRSHILVRRDDGHPLLPDLHRHLTLPPQWLHHIDLPPQGRHPRPVTQEKITRAQAEFHSRTRREITLAERHPHCPVP